MTVIRCSISNFYLLFASSTLVSYFTIIFIYEFLSYCHSRVAHSSSILSIYSPFFSVSSNSPDNLHLLRFVTFSYSINSLLFSADYLNNICKYLETTHSHHIYSSSALPLFFENSSHYNPVILNF